MLSIPEIPRVDGLKGYLFQDATLTTENRAQRPWGTHVPGDNCHVV